MNIAGADIFEPEEGDLRIIIGTVIGTDPDSLEDLPRPGKLVQQYEPRINGAGEELCGPGEWVEYCPLCDFSYLHPSRRGDIVADLTKNNSPWIK